MWNSATIMMIVEGTFATIYMTLVSTLMAYVIGLPAGVALVVTGKEGLKPNKAVNRILDVLVNVMRSIPLPDTPYPGNTPHPCHRRKKLRPQRNHCPPYPGGSPLHRQTGGILTA